MIFTYFYIYIYKYKIRSMKKCNNFRYNKLILKPFYYLRQRSNQKKIKTVHKNYAIRTYN